MNENTPGQVSSENDVPVTPPAQPDTSVIEPVVTTSDSAPAPKKSMMAGVVALLVLLLLGASAVVYGFFMPVSPEKALNKMLLAANDVKQVAYDGTVKIEMNVDATTSPFADVSGSSTSNISLNLAFSGKVDGKDEKNPALDGSVNVTGEGMVVRAQYRMLMGDVYVKLLEVPLLGFFDAGALKDQWIKIGKDSVNEAFGMKTENEDLTEEQTKQIEEAYIQYPFVTLGEKLPDEKVNGKATRHYKFMIDEEKLRLYTEKVAQISGKEISDTDAEMWEDVEFTNNEIWLGKSDYLPYRVKTDLVVSAEESGNGTFAIDVNFKDYDVPMMIEAPSDSKSIEDIMSELFGGFDMSGDYSMPDDQMTFPEGYDFDGMYPDGLEAY